LNAETFIRKAKKRTKPQTLAQISAVLRADRTLSKESADALEQILQAAYKRFQE